METRALREALGHEAKLVGMFANGAMVDSKDRASAHHERDVQVVPRPTYVVPRFCDTARCILMWRRCGAATGELGPVPYGEHGWREKLSGSQPKEWAYTSVFSALRLLPPGQL